MAQRGAENNGGTSPIIHEGDSVTIDAIQLLIQLNVDEAEIAKRRAGWKAPAPRYTRGVLGKYFKLVGTASKGAVTDYPRSSPSPAIAGVRQGVSRRTRRAC